MAVRVENGLAGADRGDRDGAACGLRRRRARSQGAELTFASFYVAGTRLIWAPAIPAALVVLAIAQIGVHLVFFLRITTAPDNTNNVLALAFGVLIVALVVLGSVWIMAHLNHNLMPMSPGAQGAMSGAEMTGHGNMP